MDTLVVDPVIQDVIGLYVNNFLVLELL